MHAVWKFGLLIGLYRSYGGFKLVLPIMLRDFFVGKLSCTRENVIDVRSIAGGNNWLWESGYVFDEAEDGGVGGLLICEPIREVEC